MQGKAGAYIEDENGIRPDEKDQAMAARLGQGKPSKREKKKGGVTDNAQD